MRLAVVICVGADSSRLEILLSSIKKQSLTAEVCVEFHLDFPNRSAGFKRASSELILFLDADCELPHEYFFAELIDHYDSQPGAQIVGGTYLNPKNASALSRSYNKLCNLWVELSESRNLLGGVFCVRKSSVIHWPQFVNFWGGEDTHLFRELAKQGMHLEMNKKFSVIHHDMGSFKKLVQRAWIHGKVRRNRKLKTPKRFEKIWTHRKNLISQMSLTEIGFAVTHLLLVELSAILTSPKISPSK